MNGTLVLTDELLILLENHHCLERNEMHNKAERKRYNKLIKAYEPSYATNYDQLIRIKDQINPIRYQRLIEPIAKNRGPKDESLKDLAQKTLFKLILTADKNQKELPYYNIDQNNPCKALTYQCKSNESREPLKQYLQKLCQNAKKVLICDNYFASNWDKTQSLLLNTLPRKSLTIEYVETAQNTASTNNSENFNGLNIHNDWAIEENTDPQWQNRHDRYLIIDDKIEVLLSSGFDYLYRLNKELTCVFREI